MSGYKVFYDSEVSYIESFINDVGVAIIGTVIDSENDLINSQEISDNVIKNYRKSKDDFFDYIDTLSGRFALFLASDKKTFILQDAIGSRSVFYDKKSTKLYLSSHAELIAEIKKYEIGDVEADFMNSEPYIKNRDRYFPGIATPYRNIKMLTPNTLLNIKDKRVERFFPRENLSQNNLDETLVREISSLFMEQNKLLSTKYGIAISLTAGLDSRLTMACSKDLKDEILYYTLTYGHNSEKDAEVARDICNALGLDHKIMNTKEDTEKEFLEMFLKNTSNMSSEFRGKIAETLYHEYPQDYIHIKSNGSEIARAFYRQQTAMLPSEISSEIYSNLYGINSKSQFVLESFKEFIEVTNLTSESIYNYDHYDLFYWEYRIGNWQSLCLYEWDIAQDTFIPFSNRNLLKKMMSIPLKDRLSDKLYYEVIENVWPETVEYPVNPFHKGEKFTNLKRIIKRLRLKVR